MGFLVPLRRRALARVLESSQREFNGLTKLSLKSKGTGRTLENTTRLGSTANMLIMPLTKNEILRRDA